MNLTHNGKIGRLPEEIREEVNVRLRQGEKGRSLAAWLNGLPEVRAMLAAEFGGKPVREQNLSEWRKGGHQQWLRAQEAQGLLEQLCAGGNGLAEMDPGKVVDNLVTFTAARYAVAMKQMLEQGGEPGMVWNQLRECCRDVARLQRAEHQAQKIELAHERLEFGREKVRAEMVMGLLKGRMYAPGGRTPEKVNDEVRMTNGEVTGSEAPSIQHPSSGETPSSNGQDAAKPTIREAEEDLVIRVNPGESDRGNFKKETDLTPADAGEWRCPRRARRVAGRTAGIQPCRRHNIEHLTSAGPDGSAWLRPAPPARDTCARRAGSQPVMPIESRALPDIPENQAWPPPPCARQRMKLCLRKLALSIK